MLNILVLFWVFLKYISFASTSFLLPQDTFRVFSKDDEGCIPADEMKFVLKHLPGKVSNQLMKFVLQHLSNPVLD